MCSNLSSKHKSFWGKQWTLKWAMWEQTNNGEWEWVFHWNVMEVVRYLVSTLQANKGSVKQGKNYLSGILKIVGSLHGINRTQWNRTDLWLYRTKGALRQKTVTLVQSMKYNFIVPLDRRYRQGEWWRNCEQLQWPT